MFKKLTLAVALLIFLLLTGAALPVLFASLKHGLPNGWQLAGFALAAPAIWLTGNPVLAVNVVALLYQIEVFIQECQSLGMWTAKAFVQLIQLHQDARISRIQRKCFFQVLNRFFFLLQFIEISQRQVSDYRWESVVNFH